MKTTKDQIWVHGIEIDKTPAGDGVERIVKSYTDELMVVENHFKKGAVGALHSHPHTQITYVVSGKFEFSIGDEKRIVEASDTMLKKDGIIHGCTCLEEGILLDIFSPMREDFV
ncbi:cupin domain-containing protein [Butyrivibrio sp. YAB3001]|uniref:cupin domain-containing protein n=1 Tax=Butyrivibrio sp. YAB3001 TaxID=1520812 RepID=UPI0008F62A39|nr:cupin domain-containing protein [Butyrivibrio sp. YAB3001]SFB82021.1 Cupin domain-containing protein [Butyrivibrio sp. YAB3001]